MIKASVENKIAVGMAISLLVFASIGFLSYRTTTNLVADQNWVTHTYQVIGTLESGQAILTDAETAQRAYLLTGDEQFQQDSKKSQEMIGGWVKNIRLQVADNPEQLRRLNQLEPLIQQRLATLNGPIDAISLQEDKKLTEQIRQIIHDLHEAENKLLADRRQAARDSARVNTLAVVFSSLAASAAVLIAFFMVTHDLRLRAQTTLEVKKSEVLMESILDNMPAIIFLKDLTGRYLFANRRFMEVSGRSREQIKGKTVFDVSKPELAKVADENFQKVLDTGKPVEFEETVIYPDGPRSHLAIKFPVRNLEGQIFAVAGISTDISERRRMEQLLRESEERLRTLVESVKDYAIIMLDPTGHVISWNAGAETIKGYKAEEILGRHFSCFYPPELVKKGFPDRQLAKAAAQGRAENEGWRLRKDGSQFWADVVITAMRNRAGQLLGFAKITQDLTERKMAEQMLQQLNESLRQQAMALETANKELEAFSYSVSHDLRSPLRHIDGFVDMLRKQAAEKLDDRGRRYLSIIADSARQMGCLIDDLLVFSRMGRTELRHTRVASNSLLDEVVKTVSGEPNGHEIQWKIHPLPEVEADPAMLRQVWANLIGNAVKYSHTRQPAKIEVGCEENNGNEYVFFVRDNGVGFDMQYVHKLFGVFQRLHRSEDFEGTGIGLANVRRIVTRHGGRTWAEGQPNQGATFYFSLPKSKPQPQTKESNGSA